MSGPVKAAVTAVQIALVMKRSADTLQIDRIIKSVGNYSKAFRDTLTIACPVIVLHGVKNKTSKYANALVAVLTEEKKATEARAIITWMEANGFKKEKHPETGKYQLAYDEKKFEAMAERIKTDELGLVSDMLASPYHLTIKNENPYRDYSLVDRMWAELKRAKKISEDEGRKSAAVKTNIAGLEKIEKFLATLN